MIKKLMLSLIILLTLLVSIGSIYAIEVNDTSTDISASDAIDGNLMSSDEMSIDSSSYASENSYIDESYGTEESDALTKELKNALSSNSEDDAENENNETDINTNNEEDSSSSDSGSGKINATVTAENTRILRSNYFNITLSDSSANPLADQTVIFSVKGNNYTKTTDSIGNVALKINLKSGNYSVDLIYPGNDGYAPISKSFDIEVYEIPTLIAVKSTKVLRGSKYTISLTDSSANPLADQTVIFNVLGKNYTRTTDSSGNASLTLNLNPGNYSIKTIFNAAEGYKAKTKTSKVSTYQIASTLSPNATVIVKGNTLGVYLRNSTGDPLSNQTVQFKFASKTYNRTTNSNGLASLKIGLNPKTYSIKLVYKGNISQKGTSKTMNLVVKSTASAASLTAKTGQLLASGSKKTVDSVSYTLSTSNKNTVLVKNGATLTLTNSKITKKGDVSSSLAESSDFYGTNAAVLVTGKSKLYISNTSIVTNAKGANAIFVSNLNTSASGATAYVENVTINTYKDKSRGLDATYNGKIIASNVTINTRGGSCAALATDRGEGTVVANRCVLNTGVGQTSGSGSPCIYSTGSITANNCTGTSYVSQIACIEGKNSIVLNNCKLTGYGKGNRYVNGSYVDLAGIFIYQSMSGDAASGVAKFNATNSKLTIPSASSYYKKAPMFFVTNTYSTITLKNTTLSFGSGILLKASGQSQWGKSGSNGGNVTFNAINQNLSGKIIIDKISSLKLTLTKSNYKGCINPSSSYGTTKVSIKSGSTWTLTGNSHVSSLSNSGTIVYGSYTLYVNGKAYTASNPYKG